MAIKQILYTTSALSLAFCISGCSQQTLNSAQNDANRDIAVVNQKANQAAQQAKPQLDKLDMETRVTAALAAAKLPTTIHVRADAEGVYLRGNVKSAQDKAHASQIAKDTLGPGKTIHNQIQVSGE